MNVVEENKKNRFLFLSKLFEITGGDKRRVAGMHFIGRELGFDRTATRIITSYLKDEQLIRYLGNNGEDISICITHNGVKEVEEALSNPDKPTEHFSPINIITVGQMVNSQIQQANSSSTQVSSMIENKKEELKSLLSELKNSIEQLGLDNPKRSDLQAEIGTIEAQLSVSKPNPSIVSQCISSIRTILEGVAGQMGASLLSKFMGL